MNAFPVAWDAVGLSVKLGLTVTLILTVLGLPLAWWLAYGAGGTNRLRLAIEKLVAFPLVLPSVVFGFFFLLFFSPDGFPGNLLTAAGLGEWAWTFRGVAFAGVLYAAPFAIQPFTEAFRSVPGGLLEISRTYGWSPLKIFCSVVFPMFWRSFVAGMLLCFLHVLGALGLVLIVGGSLSGVTQTASVWIAESWVRDPAGALSTASVLLLFVFTLFTVGNRLQSSERSSPWPRIS